MKFHTDILQNMKVFRNQTGVSLLEVIIAMCIITVVIVMSIHFIVSTQTSVVMNQDRSFAIQKALNIVNELRSVTVST